MKMISFSTSSKQHSTELLTRLASGDLTILQSEPPRKKRAFTDLVHQTAQGLKSLIRIVDRSSSQLDDQMEIIRSSSDTISHQVEGVTSTIREITIGIQDSAEQIQEAASQMSQIHSLLGQIRRDNEIVVSGAVGVSDELVEGKQEIADAAERMRHLSADSKEMHTAMGQFNVALGKIAEITKMVEEISGQTQLLSLNANIEAARAGEHGKGFAVVAQEISRLAVQSKMATSHISEHLHTIDAYAHTLANSVNGIKDTAESGAEVMDKGFERYSKVEAFITRLCVRINSVDQSISDVTDSTVAVSDTVHRTSALFEQIAAGSEEVLASAELQQRGIVTMNETIRGARRSSLSLRSAVSQFKLPQTAHAHPLKTYVDAWIERAIGIRAVMVEMIESRDQVRSRLWYEEKTVLENELQICTAKLSGASMRPEDLQYFRKLQEAWQSFHEVKEQNAKWVLQGEYEKAQQSLINQGRSRFKRALDLAQEWIDS
ncbi:methyl-accepting chemotaxis protein [Paenibacillus sp. SI8]|uniref:methyl-accepting chemotaxis protein n=1 Tax=unclassified Paenibacillus TaxID=185978 RepID=UPI003467E520